MKVDLSLLNQGISVQNIFCKFSLHDNHAVFDRCFNAKNKVSGLRGCGSKSTEVFCHSSICCTHCKM